MPSLETFIEPPAHVRIETELAAIEHEYGVRILLAVESGSRAWRFPSRDSDYDVRFIYLHPIENYLAIVPGRDVIERPIDAVLDVNGWDVRKALQLLTRSNAVLLEWLTSPVRYRDDGIVPAKLLELARSAADLTAVAYHYEHQARRDFAGIVASETPVRLKAYCYALRAAMCLRWISHFREPPPMDLPSLLSGLTIPQAASDGIVQLLALKAQSTEQDTTQRIAALDQFIGDVLAVPIEQAAQVDRSLVTARANALSASLALDDFAARVTSGLVRD